MNQLTPIEYRVNAQEISDAINERDLLRRRQREFQAEGTRLVLAKRLTSAQNVRLHALVNRIESKADYSPTEHYEDLRKRLHEIENLITTFHHNEQTINP